MELNITDPSFCRKLLSYTGIVALPNTSAAFRMGLRQALDPNDPKRKEHTKRLKKLLADFTSTGGFTEVFSNNVSKYLPRIGKTNDLYHSIFISVVNILSIASNYYGLKIVPIGRIIESEEFHNWLNTFGKSLLDSKSFSESFVEQTVRLGRMSLILNISQEHFGPLVHLFFEERSMPVPNDINDIEAFEKNYPKIATEIYFEIAIRAVRGANHIAYTLSYCIQRDHSFQGKAKMSRSNLDSVRDFVIETLRFNPPVAKIGRTTNNKENVIFDGIDIRPNTHIKFNIEEYNRSDSKTFNSPNSVSEGRMSSKKALASFGSYTYLPCPAAQFSIDFCTSYLMHFWRLRTWSPNEKVSIKDLEINKRLEVSGTFYSS